MSIYIYRICNTDGILIRKKIRNDILFFRHDLDKNIHQD